MVKKEKKIINQNNTKTTNLFFKFQIRILYYHSSTDIVE